MSPYYSPTLCLLLLTCCFVPSARVPLPPLVGSPESYDELVALLGSARWIACAIASGKRGGKWVDLTTLGTTLAKLRKAASRGPMSQLREGGAPAEM